MITVSELARDLLARGLLAPDGGTGSEDSGDGALARINDVEHDSRRVAPGALFACLPGTSADGHRFAADAVAAGAVALLAERPVEANVPCLVVESARRAVGPAAAAVHGRPCRRLDVVGVTGTNGKTTTVRLLAGLLRAAGRDTVEIGTLTGPLTTPEASDLQRTLARAADRGAGAAAVEVSSHGLAQHRLDGCRFRAAAFTNLGRDHLDFHGSVEDYFAAKASLFTGALTERAVVDVSSPWGRRLADLAVSEIPVTEVDGRDVELLEADARSSVFRWRGRTVALPMGGSFNRANAVLAAETAVALGLAPEAVAAGLAGADQVPGRFESVDAGQDFAVIVDFAHTADGLAAVLPAAREVTRGALTVVFGAGGDRDRGKRPEMGATAEQLADRVIVTSDNPRSEDPVGIIDDIVAGMARPPELRDPDRRRALRHAVAAARPGDTVVIAGKGHETGQTGPTGTVAFDDRTVVREELAALAACASVLGEVREGSR